MESKYWDIPPFLYKIAVVPLTNPSNKKYFDCIYGIWQYKYLAYKVISEEKKHL